MEELVPSIRGPVPSDRSPSALTQSGRVYAYDDWGNDAGTGGTLAAPNADRARWKGALWMGPELDLYYMRNRWYEPATGRFLSEDPVGLGGGINPVVFTAGDPVNGRDPSGLGIQGPPVCGERCEPHTPDGFLEPTPTLAGDEPENSGGGSGGRPAAGPIPEACKAALKDLGISLLFDAAGGGIKAISGLRTLALAARQERAALGLLSAGGEFARAGNGALATAQLNAGLGLLNRSVAGRTGVELGVLSSVTGSVGANLTGGGAIGLVGRGVQAAASPSESTLKRLGLALPYLGSLIRIGDAIDTCF